MASCAGVRGDTGEELLPLFRVKGNALGQFPSSPLPLHQKGDANSQGSASTCASSSQSSSLSSPETGTPFNAGEEEAEECECTTAAAKAREATNVGASLTLAQRSPVFNDYVASHPQAVVIGIRGFWYDVTQFRHRHPGGAVLLEKVHGKDCTEMYEAFHEKDYLKFFPKIGPFTPEDSSNIRNRFRELGEEFRRDGLFDTSYTWYGVKFAFIISLLLICVHLVHGAGPGGVSTVRAIIAGLFLGLFWQQSGFVMHDAMHSDITHNSTIDRSLGLLFGSLFLGVSSHWWRDEHFEHHAFTNVIDRRDMYADPQMVEEAWVQDRMLFATLVGPRPAWKRVGQRVLIACQGWAWVLLAMLVGRVAIAVDALNHETRWYEWTAVGAHNALTLWFLCTNSFTPWTAFAFWYTAAVAEGVLHVQLLVNHYPKPWTALQDLCEGGASWAALQVKQTLNIKTPWWMDWFYGGLNYHIEHHLYPNMPRHNFSRAQKRVRQVCAEVGLPYDEADFMESILVCCKKMHHLAFELESWWGGPTHAQWLSWFKAADQEGTKAD